MQCTGTQLANVHAHEYEGVVQHPILPNPARIQQRYDTVAEHIHFVRGGLSLEEDEYDVQEGEEPVNTTVTGNVKVGKCL